MKRALLRACAAVFVPIAVASGQPATPKSISYKLGDVIEHLRVADSIVGLPTAEPKTHRMFDSVAKVLRDAGLMSMPLTDVGHIVQGDHAGVRAVARWNDKQSGAWTQRWFAAAVDSIRVVTNGSIVPRASPTDARMDSLLAPAESLSAAILEASMQRNAEKLRRFEIKYGPDSPRLNAAEVALNYLAQFVAPFKANANGPSPLEIVATYSTSDVGTQTDGTSKVRVVSNARLGLRSYVFASGWGTGGRFSRLIKPRTIAAGVAFMGPANEPLGNPWGSGRRIGGFVSWGALQVGAVGGPKSTIAVGTGKHIIPYIF